MDLEQKRLRKLQELDRTGRWWREPSTGSSGKTRRADDGVSLADLQEVGKTRSVYVPKDLVKEVQSWIGNHRRVKQVLSEISTLSIGIIQRHVAQKRASGPDAGANRRAKPNSR